MMLGPDGNIWFSETEVSQIGRITPDGKITEFKDGITPGSKPLSIVVRDGALWFSEAAGNHVGRITVDGTGHRVPDPEPRQPAARHVPASRTARSGSSQTSANALCRIDRDGGMTEYKVTTPDASLRSVCVGAGRRPLVHRELRQQDRPHGAGRHHARRIRHPDAGQRRALHHRDVGRPASSSRNGMPA